MQKLAAADAGFLYTETRNMPNHIAAFQILALPDGMDASGFVERVIALYSGRIHLVPYLYRKIRFTPGNVDHPVWVTDRDFDIRNHVRHVTLSPPGTMRQLEEKIAEIHSERLDRARPLWQLVIITGLEDERHVAYYSQAHHACLDGVAGTAATEILMDDTPTPRPVEPPAQFPPEDADDEVRLFELSLENLVASGIDAPLRFVDTIDFMSRMWRRAFDPGSSFGAWAERVPKTRFNRAIRKERSYAVCDFAFSDVKAVKQVAGCSLNDVILAICAGGLRTYLERKGELPRTALIAGVPVSLRKPGDSKMNNQVTMMNVSLATHIENPLERLLLIAHSERVAKEVVSEAAMLDQNVSIPGLPAMITQGAWMADALGIADTMQPPVNVVISNVPGPRKTLYSAGARLLAHYPVSIPAQALGVNITVHSYVDRFYLGITACARALPDPGVLRDDILAALTELESLVLRRPAEVKQLESARQVEGVPHDGALIDPSKLKVAGGPDVFPSKPIANRPILPDLINRAL